VLNVQLFELRRCGVEVLKVDCKKAQVEKVSPPGHRLRKNGQTTEYVTSSLLACTREEMSRVITKKLLKNSEIHWLMRLLLVMSEVVDAQHEHLGVDVMDCNEIVNAYFTQINKLLHLISRHFVYFSGRWQIHVIKVADLILD
jgi:hypothetical protein